MKIIFSIRLTKIAFILLKRKYFVETIPVNSAYFLFFMIFPEGINRS